MVAGLLQRLSTSSYGEMPNSREAESDSDASSEDGAKSQKTVGKRVSDDKDPRTDESLGVQNGSNSLSALDPSTLDMLVRKLEAVEDFAEVGQGTNAGSSSEKSRRRRKKRSQVVGEQEDDGVRGGGENVGTRVAIQLLSGVDCDKRWGIREFHSWVTTGAHAV